MKKLAAVLFFLAMFSLPVHAQPLGNSVALQETSTGTASSVVLSTQAANLYSLGLANTTTAGFLMVFPLATAPGDGAVTPALCYNIPANTGFHESYSWPVTFPVGITAVFSVGANCFAKTAAPAFIFGQAQ